MQIEFERSIQLIDDNFVLKEKLDTENIMYFLNVAQERYLKETYLSKASLQENVQFLQKRADDLKQLVKRTDKGRAGTNDIVDDNIVALYSNLINETTGTLVTTEDGGMVLRLPYDYIYYMLSRSKITRSTVAVASGEWTSNKVITHDELDNIIRTPFNDPILRKPCVLFEDTENMVIYSDSDTTISDVELIYIRKPNILLLETYTEHVAGGVSLDNATDYTVVEVDDTTGIAVHNLHEFTIGETFTSDAAAPMTSGTVALSHLAFGTNTCELAEYTHQEIVDLAVKIFIEDVKYKLMPNERARRVQEAQARQ